MPVAAFALPAVDTNVRVDFLARLTGERTAEIEWLAADQEERERIAQRVGMAAQELARRALEVCQRLYKMFYAYKQRAAQATLAAAGIEAEIRPGDLIEYMHLRLMEELEAARPPKQRVR